MPGWNRNCEKSVDKASAKQMSIRSIFKIQIRKECIHPCSKSYYHVENETRKYNIDTDCISLKFITFSTN